MDYIGVFIERATDGLGIWLFRFSGLFKKLPGLYINEGFLPPFYEGAFTPAGIEPLIEAAILFLKVFAFQWDFLIPAFLPIMLTNAGG